MFGVAAALLLLWWGPEAYLSRWSPLTIVLTHLLTLGFLTMVMCGATLQLIPVVSGSRVPATVPVSRAVHLLLSCGVVALGAGLVLSHSSWTIAGLAALLSALTIYIVVASIALARAPQVFDTVKEMRLALGSLATALILGVYLGTGHTPLLSSAPRQLADIHLAWALLGWVGLLIIGVAYQVVPMFQITPSYPRTMTRWLGMYLILSLVLWSISAFSLPEWASDLAGTLLAAGFGAFAVVTLHLQQRRRRRLPDVTLAFWRLAMLSLLAGIALWLVGRWINPVGDWPGYGIALGVLLIVGFALSAVSGMLYKIVPFLVWLHLQNWRPAPVNSGIPNMKAILPDKRARRQFLVHVAALMLLLAASVWPPWITRIAAAVFGVSGVMLTLNLFSAANVYQTIVSSNARNPADSTVRNRAE